MKWSLGILVLTLMAGSVTAQAEATVKAGDGNDPSVAAVTVKDDSIYRSTTKGPYYYQSTSELKARKLARGLANVTLCVAEIPNQMFREAYRTSPVTGSVVGLWKGVKKGSARLVVGAWEIVTFYVSTNNYQPYIEPEVVFQEDIY